MVAAAARPDSGQGLTRKSLWWGGVGAGQGEGGWGTRNRSGELGLTPCKRKGEDEVEGKMETAPDLDKLGLTRRSVVAMADAWRRRRVAGRGTVAHSEETGEQQ